MPKLLGNIHDVARRPLRISIYNADSIKLADAMSRSGCTLIADWTGDTLGKKYNYSITVLNTHLLKVDWCKMQVTT